jgi:serine/threonine protein kinase
LGNSELQVKFGAFVGQGSFGSVHQYTQCAKKSIITTEKEFEKEAGVMACLNHPNIVKFTCCHRDSDERAIVMEYMPINLDVFIRQRGGFPFTAISALDTVSQITSIMEYLHGEEVVHRDLKPNNILVSPVTIPELGADGYGKVKFVQAAQCSIPIRTAIFPV